MHKHFILLFSGIIFFITAEAQTYRHPYSYYGIGEPIPSLFSTQHASGGISMGWNDSLSYAPLNPASLSSIRYTVFDFSSRIKTQLLKQDTNSFLNTYPNFGYFSLAFPSWKKYGMGTAFGLLPVSIIGFRNKYSFSSDTITWVEDFQHDGGFSKFYFSQSVCLFQHLNLGVSAGYIFGNIELNNSLTFDDKSNHLGVTSSIIDNFGGFALDLGTQYKANIGDKIKLTVGGYYKPECNLNAYERRITRAFYNNSISNRLLDTLYQWEKEVNGIIIPSGWGAGFSVASGNKWKAGADVISESWSQFTAPNANYSLNDMLQIRAGGEIIPSPEGNNGYFSKINYRFGATYIQSYLTTGGYDFTRSSVSIGAGFPFPRKLSTINVSVEAGTQGKDNGTIIRENFLNIYLGIKLVDTWFIKPKYD